MILMIDAISRKHILERPSCSLDVRWAVPVEGLHPHRARIPQAFPPLHSICHIEHQCFGIVLSGRF